MRFIDGTYFLIYPVILIFEILFSYVTWVFFWLITEIINVIVTKQWLKKSLITVAGVVLVYYTYYKVAPVESYSIKDMNFTMLLSDALLVVLGSWYFNVGPNTTPETLTDSLSSIRPHEN